jgi:nuclear pore complex protein Nup93
MMAYDRVITDLNSARLRGISYPVVHALIDASIQTTSDPRQTQTTQLFHILSKITVEPPSLPPIEHAGAHILNTPLFSRKFARAYLADPTSQQAMLLRAQIASGARRALEEQYYDVLLRTVSAHAGEARLGGDPSISNKVRAFLAVRYYRGGEWEGGVEIVAGQPIWAKLFYLVRTGYVEEAVREAERMSGAIEGREPGFVGIFRTWLESIERR